MPQRFNIPEVLLFQKHYRLSFNDYILVTGKRPVKGLSTFVFVSFDMPTPYPAAADATLIALFLQGNQSAFETLLLRYKDRIYTSIYLLVKDRSLAEDLFQDCFLKILRTLREGRYDEQGKFLPWALRVAHNLCMDHFRRTRTHATVLCGDDQVLNHLSGGSVAELRLEKQQTEAGIHALIGKLPEEQQKVVVLRIYGELSFKEIAEETGVSINTALGRMRYALINLRKLMEGDVVGVL